VNEASVLASFCFIVREREEGIAFLDVVVVVVSLAIEHFTCSCLCYVCVCVCMAGRYCFRLIAAVVVDFSPLLFTHTHSHMPLIFFLYFIAKKNEKHFHSSYIRIYFNSSFFFSSSYVITHPFFLFVAYLSFLLLLNLFSLTN
jgi:hypothetical protein